MQDFKYKWQCKIEYDEYEIYVVCYKDKIYARCLDRLFSSTKKAVDFINEYKSNSYKYSAFKDYKIED